MKRRGAGTIAVGDVGSRVRLQAWVQRRRDLGGLLFLDLRDRSGVVQVVIRPEPQPRGGAGPGPRPRRVGGRDRGHRRAPRAGAGQPRAADRRGRGHRRARRRPLPLRAAAVPPRRQGRGRRGHPAALPLPRPAPAGAAEELRAPPPGHARGPQLLPRAGLPRRRDADPHQVDARGRARLPGAVARPPRRASTPCRSRRSSSSSS